MECVRAECGACLVSCLDTSYMMTQLFYAITYLYMVQLHDLSGTEPGLVIEMFYYNLFFMSLNKQHLHTKVYMHKTIFSTD